MTPDQLNLAVLVVAGVIVAGVAAVRISAGSGMPGLLLYIGIGALIGEAGLGIQFWDPNLTFNVASVFLALLLTDGGFTTSWRNISPVLTRSALLATAGVVLSVAVTATLTWFLLGVDVRVAILLAAMVSSTDAAATFSILRRLPIKTRVRTTLEAESGLNDPPAIVLVSVVASDLWNQTSVVGMIGIGLYQLAIGALVGLIIARIGQLLLAHISLPASGLYPVATIAIALTAFAVAGLAGASGLLACYVAGIWLGNQTLPHKRATQGFTEASGYLSQIGLFVMLGLLASPSELVHAVIPAIVIGSALTFVARPFSVLVCLSPFKVGIKEQAFVSWAGLRGAVPIVLATIPLTHGIEGARGMFHIIFVLVVSFTLVQGPLLPSVAKWMGVTEELAPHELSFESAPLEGIKASLVQFHVPDRSRLVGMYISDLRLPSGAMLSMVIRAGEVLVPAQQLRLQANDELLLAVRQALVPATQRRLAALSERGHLARWKMHPQRWQELFGPRPNE